MNKQIKGIDISYANPQVDFKAVKKAGIEFVIIRTGYRQKTDTMFESHINGALAAGLDVGVYCYCLATTPEQARAEADYVVSLIKPYKLTYPVFYDMEDSRLEILSRTKLTNIASAFLNRIKSAGYYSALYANPAWLENRLNRARLTGFDVWLAAWTNSPDIPTRYDYSQTMWQWGAGKMTGITGNVDGDICYVDYPSVIGKNAAAQSSAVRTTAFLNIRKAPGTSSAILGVIPKGAAVTVSGVPVSADGYHWRKIRYGKIVGYAASEYLVTA